MKIFISKQIYIQGYFYKSLINSKVQKQIFLRYKTHKTIRESVLHLSIGAIPFINWGENL